MPTEAQTAQWIRLTEGRLAPIHRSGNSLYFIQELERPPLPEPEDEQARRDLAVPQTPLVRGFQLDLETLQFSEIPVNVRPVTLPLPKPPSGGSRPPDAGVVWIFELGGVSLPRHTALGSRAVSDRFVAFTDDLDSAVWIMELATGKLSKVTADSVAGMNRDELLTQVACNPSAPLEWAQIFCDPNAGLIWTSSGLFTPDGGSLVYASNRRAYQILASAYQAGQASPSHWYWNDLWIVGIDGSNERLLYDGQGFSLVTPLGWTPDGQLVLLRYREAPDYSVSLALLNMTTGDVQNVVEGHLGDLYLSPDGRYLFYLEGVGPDFNAAILDFTSRSTNYLGDLRGLYFQDFAGWSPDGSRFGLVMQVPALTDQAGASSPFVSIVSLTPSGPSLTSVRPPTEAGRGYYLEGATLLSTELLKVTLRPGNTSASVETWLARLGMGEGG